MAVLTLCIKVQGKIEICIKWQQIPRVTHGKKLCKPSLELLMGLNYMQNFPWVTHGTEICKIILHNLLKGGEKRVITWDHFMQITRAHAILYSIYK